MSKSLLRLLLAATLITSVSCTAATHSASETGPRRAAVPGGGLVPDVVMAAGRLHLVFGRDGHAWYASSTDGGRTFSAPVRISNDASKPMIGHERGPKVALGHSGAIHVAWPGESGNRVFVTRSSDGGRTFSTPHNVAPPKGLDSASIAADGKGNVYVAWMAGEARGGAAASLIYLATSGNNGETFSPAKTIETNYPNNAACACCNLKAFIGPEGRFNIAFRGANNNIRDVYLLRADAGASRFGAFRVSEDNWRLEGCPMQGPWVETVTDNRTLLVAWASQGKVYRAVSSDAGETFSARTPPAAASSGTRRDPLVVRNGRGEVLFAWMEQRALHWERRAASGEVVETGSRADVPSRSRFVAFVDGTGEFVFAY